MRLLVTPAIALALLGNLAVGQICPRSLSIRSVEDSTASFLDLLNLSDRPNPLSRSIEPRQELGWDPRVSMPRGPVCNSGDSYTVAQCEIDILKARGCNVLACVSAAAACLASCATAAGQGALDPIADLACLAAIGSFTAACADCDPRNLTGGGASL